VVLRHKKEQRNRQTEGRGQRARGGVERLSLDMIVRDVYIRVLMKKSDHPRKVNTGRVAAMIRAESVMGMPGRGGPVDVVETLVLADVDTVVVGVVATVGLIEKLVTVKEIEMEETAQKSFASWILCFN